MNCPRRATLWALLLTPLLWLAIACPAAEQNLLDVVGRQARTYANRLARDRGANYTMAERMTLRTAADLLLQHHHCSPALQLAKQVASGPAGTPTEDWIRLSRVAQCARSWRDAVFAASLGYQSASHKDDRRAALMLLGTALEGHWNYGTRYALAAYREALNNGAPRTVRKRIHALEKTLAEEQTLRLDRFFVQRNTAQPTLCLDFSAAMPEPSAQRYGDYIRFEPSFQARFRKEANDEVCAEGAAFGTVYQLRILPGLRAEDGAQVTKPLDYQIEAGDRPPALWFGNSRYVLPRGGGVPVHGVNVARARLTLYRVVDRNLLNEEVRRLFRTDLNGWQAQRIRDELGEQVWQGEADLVVSRNREAVTNLPLAERMPPEPGIYILTAAPYQPGQDPDAQSDTTLAALWLLVSDIGITSYQGADGLTLVTRSLATAQPLAGVRLALYARNNRLLGEAVSDAAGVARLPATSLDGRGGRKPMTLMASGPEQDFNILDLSAAPYDLSDRGVAGRPVPGPVDAFLYTERGVYRPGEPVYLAALLRNERGQAVDGLPLTLRLLRPDEQVAAEQVVNSQGGGGYSLALPLSPGARTGHWKVLAYLDPKAAPIGHVAFQVEAIVPPRIEVDVEQTPPSPLKPGVSGPFGVRARYLFGAPAADLTARGEVRIAADPNPFPTFPGYRFGVVDEPDDSVLEPLAETRTDAQGEARFEVQIDRLPKLGRPLQARLRAEVIDVDGRAVATSQVLPVRQQPLYIGIKPPGEGGQLQEGAEARFQILALDPEGQTVSGVDLDYRLIKEKIDYHWYRNEGRWQFKRQVRDQILQEGQVTVAANVPTGVGLPLPYGRYRLEVRDPTSGMRSSVRVRVGWMGGGMDAETPDMLGLRSDRRFYRPGEMARLHVQAPFTGPASLVIATDRVLSVRPIELREREQTLEVPVEAHWGAGAYVLVTAYRPDAGAVGHGPRRAVGVAWLGLAPALHRLALAIEAPDQTRPGRSLEIGVRVSDPPAAEGIYVTLAAVDEGVLQLTDYHNPDPLGHYFGQRILGVGLRDLYGRLINGHEGAPGHIRSGGGASGRRGAPDSHIQIVSLFSGVVRLDATGQARIPFDLPDFNGRLRLVGVAWSEERVGAAATALTVRDPVVLMPSMPRFLAAGDQAQLTLLLHNVAGVDGDYRLSWASSGPLRLGTGPGGPAETAISLQQGSRRVFTLPVAATAMGNGTVRLQLTAPTGEVLKRKIAIGVRAPFLPERESVFGHLASGEEVRLGPAMVEGLRPETVTGLLSVSSTPALDVPGLLRQLDLYPYGCLEQVVSRAFPLLHVKRLAELWHYRSQVPVSKRLAEAITRILEKQLANGGFALWRPSGEEEPWLTAYTLDFLQRARAAGVEMPEFLWERGLGWLRRQVTYPETRDPQGMAVQAYALYLLARHGDKPAETARYLLEQAGDKLPSGMAALHLGAALAYLGDPARAQRAFALARAHARADNLRDYGSRLRDLAALVLIMSETQGGREDLATLVQELGDGMAKERWLSTQEQAWLVRAANAVTGEAAPLALKFQDTPMPKRQTPLVVHAAAPTLARGLHLANVGQGAAWYSLAVDGSPREAPSPLVQGFKIRRRLLSLTGTPVDPRSVSQGTLMVVVLEGRATTKGMNHQALILDPLPAGLEIENPNLANAAAAGDLAWVGELSGTSYTDALDDRFVAALDLTGTKRTFRLAYLARAVTPGHYQAPPPLVEDMYKPRYRGRGDSGWLDVSPVP